jgi:hypothetical protein
MPNVVVLNVAMPSVVAPLQKNCPTWKHLGLLSVKVPEEFVRKVIEVGPAGAQDHECAVGDPLVLLFPVNCPNVDKSTAKNGATTISIMTLGIMTLGILGLTTTLSMTILNTVCH